MKGLVIVCVVGVIASVACNRMKTKPKVANSDPSDPAALRLNQQLLDTAKGEDVDAFKALLSAQSVRLLEEHFEQMELLQRTPGEQPYGWRQFMQIHADLPVSVRNKASYPIIIEHGQPKVDISAHPNVEFLRHGIHMPLERGPEKPTDRTNPAEIGTP